MADPVIVNRRPDESETGVAVSMPFRFGVRDADTRVDLGTVHAAVLYSTAVFEAAALPAVDPALAGTSVVFSTFNDAAGVSVPGNPCDQTLESSGLRIEKSDVDGSLQEGVFFVDAAAQGVRPYAVTAQIDLASVQADVISYLPWADAVGVLLGLVYWPENTGVFLFFRDDGTKRVSVVGPATDGVGTRSVETTVVFDWSAEAYTYSIHIDPTIFRRKVLVFATDSEGEETLLAELSLDSFNEFLGTARMGKLYAATAPDRVQLVVGMDAPDTGNYVDITNFALFGFGAVLAMAGGPTAASEITVTPFESLLAAGSEGLAEWRSQGTGTLELTDNSVILTATEGGSFYFRDEPDLADGEWLVLGKLAGRSTSHPGSYKTGMLLSVEDGTTAFRLHLLDDFADNLLGVEEADEVAEDPSGFKLDQTGQDWFTAFTFEMLGSASRDELVVQIDGATAIEHTYAAAGYPASTQAGVKLGFVEEGTFTGSFYLFYLWVFPNCTFFEPGDATYPESQGWLRAASSGTRSLPADLEVDCTAAGAFDIYYLDDATYDATSGAALIFEASISKWTDSSLAASPPRSEFGPIAAIRTTTVAAQLYFVRDLTGTVFLYLSSDASDVSDVLAQNAAGRSRSIAIEEDTEHLYILDVKPFHSIRVYLDRDPVPVIDIPWAESSSSLRALPTNMPGTAVVAVGSLGEDAGVEIAFANFRASIGRGYDFHVTPVFSEEEMQEHVYGASAVLLLDVQDED